MELSRFTILHNFSIISNKTHKSSINSLSFSISLRGHSLRRHLTLADLPLPVSFRRHCPTGGPTSLPPSATKSRPPSSSLRAIVPHTPYGSLIATSSPHLIFNSPFLILEPSGALNDSLEISRRRLLVRYSTLFVGYRILHMSMLRCSALLAGYQMYIVLSLIRACTRTSGFLIRFCCNMRIVIHLVYSMFPFPSVG
ncbi:unnamed protein product [Vicia faba]|uniref:Uncharacterized protein n=1 Tax=Vicia faba TaxID=3906 RepID=A0AAV1AU38_VICFA|nr:unnamed protein product [Vicia faba]